MKYALITGGLGFIGSYIAKELIGSKQVDKVVLLDHYGRYSDSTKDTFIDYRKIRIADIKNNIIIERGEAKFYSVLYKLLNLYQPEYIFHMAALPLAKLENLNTEEAMEGSVESTSNILEIIGNSQNYRPKRFIYTSSSMVYGDFVEDPAIEIHPTKPKEIYGTMKLAGEIITKGLCEFYNIPYTIIRPSAVFGPTDMNRRVSQIFVEKAIQNQTIKINGIDEKLDFSYVKDVAYGFVLAATHDKGVNEIFNITHGKAHKLIDFVNELQKHFKDLNFEVTKRDEFRPKRGTLSIVKAQNLLGYKPKYSFQEAVGEYVDFMLKYYTNRNA